MAIPQTIFYLAGYFTGSSDVAADLKKTLVADGYCPETARDILIIVYDNLFPTEIPKHVTYNLLHSVSAQPYQNYDIDIKIVMALSSYVKCTLKKLLGLSNYDTPDFSLFPSSDIIKELCDGRVCKTDS